MTDPVQRAAEIAAAARAEIGGAPDPAALERLRVTYLGQRSELMTIPRSIGKLPSEQRSAVGQAFNAARTAIEEALAGRAGVLEEERLAHLAEREAIDVTFPGRQPRIGHLHILTETQREVERVMESMGYSIELGPEVETDWYNFEALNLPVGHASRDMQETLFLNQEETLVLRTHTSPMQIRSLEKYRTPPIYAAAPGRVFRRENLDASHLAQFMQLEAIAVDEGITVGDLKGTVEYFSAALWGPDRTVRFRPSYFPYTEPSFEFDVSCGVCGGRGCRSCGGWGWLEAGGCGMMHPTVLRNGGVGPERYSGFAWGFGIERIAMLKYDIHDLRLFYDNDLRFLEQ
ncbi:MAG: phenylalanine--tRNA ligase subunit alpha, partial [Candidatus Dormibacteraeota bacterium]|nr:phenylalanine--tRNA ligase subunit alpha [Candidatus Dormibacteraeota bacterium]